MASPDFNSSTGASSTNASDRGVIDRVKDRAAAQLSSQKDKATDGLGSVAQFVRQGHSSCAINNTRRSPVMSSRLRIRSTASRNNCATRM